MEGSGNKRINKELMEITKTPLPGMEVKVDYANVHEWKIIMDGPPETPYASGKFTLLLVLPKDYPFKPPKINFKTKIFHPNITADEHGSMCLGILKVDQWKPSSKITSILEAAQQLLVEPNPDDAVEERAGNLYRHDRKEWEKQAREWTERYAKV